LHSLEFNWTFYITAIGSYTLARSSHRYSAWIIYYIVIPFLNLANKSFHWFHKYGKYQINHFSFYTIILFSPLKTKADMRVVHCMEEELQLCSGVFSYSNSKYKFKVSLRWSIRHNDFQLGGLLVLSCTHVHL